MDAADEVAEGDPTGDGEKWDMMDTMSRALAVLPERERQVLTLFYMGQYSQAEVGAFLDIQEKTVKSRLHSARKCLRERMTEMVEKDLQTRRPSKDEKFVAEVIDDLVELTDLEIDALLRQVEQKDLVVALKGASEQVKEKLLGSIPSKRVRRFMEECIAQLDPVSADEVEEVRRHILEKVAHIKPKPKPKLSKEYMTAKNDLKKKLQQSPSALGDFDALTEILVGLAEVRDTEGIMAFHDVVPDTSPADLLQLGVRTAGDGCEPRLLADFLEERMRLLLQEQELRHRMIIKGLVAIQEGDSLEVVEERLSAVRQGGTPKGNGRNIGFGTG